MNRLEQVQELQAKIRECSTEIGKIQSECPHENILVECKEDYYCGGNFCG